MIAAELEPSLRELSEIQRKAVEWSDGALLVLAGPGSGKTRVLTCRAARLLERSRNERFRILALTFTNKAAHEISSRVSALVPGLDERAEIQTFHSFCAQVLRQHGAHLGIKPDFAIYSLASDRQAVLEDAIRREKAHFDSEDLRLLPIIDLLKARLVEPKEAETWATRRRVATQDEASRLARTYRLYERELRRSNALDFHSLILEVYRLFQYPVMAHHYQTVYRYWLIDEFQDTNHAQYALLRRMAGDTFRQVFAVADDDQTIYEWNGASVRRIGDLVEEFDCEVVQLPTNYRCPPPIVAAANRLLVYNARRAGTKRPAEPEWHDRTHYVPPIECRVFDTDEKEVAGIASEIADLTETERRQTLVLARTRALLSAIHASLREVRVAATILTRRDEFESPEMKWLVACLKQIGRPLDRRNMDSLVEAFNNFASTQLDFDDLTTRSAALDVACLSVWIDAAKAANPPPPAAELVDAIAELAAGETRIDMTISTVLSLFERDDPDDRLKDDISAWRRLLGEIRSMIGPVSRDRLLQELELRSKEPAPAPGSVTLATFHGAKGLEFDCVYVIGLAEEILPSWHSMRRGDSSAALEEERRGCFVAVTRTRNRLILSRARRYKGWERDPSRFLVEMGVSCDERGNEQREVSRK